jgi:cobalt-zinc-cadmium efflux system protein
MSRGARLWAVLVANLALVCALTGVGITAQSLGVWAEGADYLADAAAIGVSLFAINLSSRAPTPKHPDSYPRATRYAAAVNGGWLLLLSLLVAAGGADRLISGVRQVHGLPVLVVSGVAAVVMLAGALLLGPDLGNDANDDLHVRAVLLDTGADAAAATGVAGAGAGDLRLPWLVLARPCRRARDRRSSWLSRRPPLIAHPYRPQPVIRGRLKPYGEPASAGGG